MLTTANVTGLAEVKRHQPVTIAVNTTTEASSLIREMRR
jgi:hypothetical protein